MTRRDKALNFRRVTQTDLSNIDDATAVTMLNMFDEWSGESVVYTTGDRIVWLDILYRVTQGHTSQADWPPNVAVSLFEEV